MAGKSQFYSGIVSSTTFNKHANQNQDKVVSQLNNQSKTVEVCAHDWAIQVQITPKQARSWNLVTSRYFKKIVSVTITMKLNLSNPTHSLPGQCATPDPQHWPSKPFSSRLHPSHFIINLFLWDLCNCLGSKINNSIFPNLSIQLTSLIIEIVLL